MMQAKIILFPASPINPRLIDDAWAPEAEAAAAEGFTVGRVDLEAILGGEIRVRGLPEIGPDLYRGWLMTPPRYEALHEHLGGRLVTPPAAYQTAYHLPEWLSLFQEGDTPRTLVIPGEVFDLKDVAAKVLKQWLELPGPRPVILKDYLKSAKHRWFDACFIPDCRNLEDTMRVTKNFIDTQGDNLTGGLCFREFVECKPLGVHPRTQQPLVNEWRAFLRFGEVFSLRPYWGGQDYGPVSVPDAGIIEAMSKGLSKLPFVALDFAEKLDGGWVIFEVNDGGSAGIPDGLALPDFYQKLHKAFT